MINKFRFVINGKIILFLTKKNYSRIVGNPFFVRAINDMILELDAIGNKGMVISREGYTLQIDKL